MRPGIIFFIICSMMLNSCTPGYIKPYLHKSIFLNKDAYLCQRKTLYGVTTYIEQFFVRYSDRCGGYPAGENVPHSIKEFKESSASFTQWKRAEDWDFTKTKTLGVLPRGTRIQILEYTVADGGYGTIMVSSGPYSGTKADILDLNLTDYRLSPAQ